MAPSRRLGTASLVPLLAVLAVPAAVESAGVPKVPRVKGTVTIERTEDLRTGGEFNYTVASKAQEKMTFTVDLRPTPGNAFAWKLRPGKVNLSHTFLRTDIRREPDNKASCTMTRDVSYTRAGLLRPFETQKQGQLGYSAAMSDRAVRIDVKGYLAVLAKLTASPLVINVCSTNSGTASDTAEVNTGPGAQVYERCYPAGASPDAKRDSVSGAIWGVWRKAKRRYDFDCKLDVEKTTDDDGSFRNVAIKVSGALKQY